MIVLGLETSCDETAVGIVTDTRRICANRIASQTATHAPYGGVVPEIAARAHLQHLDGLVTAALQDAGLRLEQIDGIAATCGPGLIGGVMVGAMFAKGLAAAQRKPFIAVNHLEGHALTARLTHDATFPFLLLLISGGHCQILLARGVGAYTLLGTTIDDAAGECFDKTAKLLGLPYPGGPEIEKQAAMGDPTRFTLPRPFVGREDCDFSFSGLKTAVRTLAAAQDPADQHWRADLAAALQTTVGVILADRVDQAIKRLTQRPTALVVAGGVAANRAIGAALKDIAAQHALPLLIPPAALCTDNGVMIAWAGVERLRLGLIDPLTVGARPRWPLAELDETTTKGTA